MFKSLAAAVLLVIGSVSAPVAALNVYDAFTSFNGVQGNGGFTYGSYTDGNFTPFTATSGCGGLISGTICLNDGYLPGAFKTVTGAHQSGTVIVPDDRLILHPGEFDNAAYVMFTATRAGTYFLGSEFTVQDTNPSGVDISFFLVSGGDVQFVDYITSLSSTYTSDGYFDFGLLAAGDSVGFIIDKGDAYHNDSTGVGFALIGVPEPATWSLLITGFGMTGFVLRRRRSVVPA